MCSSIWTPGNFKSGSAPARPSSTAASHALRRQVRLRHAVPGRRRLQARCAGKKQSSGGGAVPVNPAAVAHTTCTCGEHCSCRPCPCGRLGSGDGAGRADCTCGPTCTCVVCTA
ncbi:class II metallothionein-like protein 1A isoform X1 [Triticum aestivum]|uniref:class II metallothionein-like protein 1A isoform X1 n=1 Tax=Triticum aestivum TaxID=4565 RepID=UPI001D029C55|nr:class II metallothionein-like protein 1A isoform X1 [Triticum aestivum]